MNTVILKKNFIYPVIPKTAFKFGANNFPSAALRPDGDWRNFRPLEEYQNKNGVESSACYIYAQSHAIATLQEEQFGLLDQDYSDRFNAYLSGGTTDGGDPLAGAESMRKLHGMIPESLLPFNNEIKSWSDFHSFKGGTESLLKKKGREFLSNWKLNYDIVFQREDALGKKLTLLREALKYSPCPISVYGVTNNGEYVEKPEWASDTHLVLAVYIDSDDCIWIFDTYAPVLKKLPPKYNSDFAIRWAVTKLESKKKAFWSIIMSCLQKILK